MCFRVWVSVKVRASVSVRVSAIDKIRDRVRLRMFFRFWNSVRVRARVHIRVIILFRVET